MHLEPTWGDRDAAVATDTLGPHGGLRKRENTRCRMPTDPRELAALRVLETPVRLRDLLVVAVCTGASLRLIAREYIVYLVVDSTEPLRFTCSCWLEDHGGSLRDPEGPDAQGSPRPRDPADERSPRVTRDPTTGDRGSLERPKMGILG